MTKKTKQEKERQAKAFRRWYKRHGKELNAKRRERYHKDQEYRKKCIENARRGRSRVRRNRPIDD